jgi:hypothetical protein
MNQQIQEMFASAEGRYLSTQEQGLLREWAQGLDARLAAMSEISAKESTIVEQTVKEIFRAYPDIEKKYKNAMQTCIRDETMVLRYTALAMLRNDPQYLNDTLLNWLATILKGVGFAPHFIEDTYKTMALVAGRELSPATAKLLHPFVLQCAAVLSGRDSSKEAK